jgi:hypothetical protein
MKLWLSVSAMGLVSVLVSLSLFVSVVVSVCLFSFSHVFAGAKLHELREAGAKEDLIGRELYVAASMINHSCRPNCLVVRTTGHASVVAQDTIKVASAPPPPPI